MPEGIRITEPAVNKSSFERRLLNLTVQTLRNYCDVKGITGASQLKKKELAEMLIEVADPNSLELFLSACEAEYLMDSFRKAVKWGMSENLVQIGPKSTEKELHAEFNGLNVGLRRMFYIDFFKVTDAKNFQSSCECDDSTERGLFCPHQMATLLRGLDEKKLHLSRWRGPMTEELKNAIKAMFP